LFRGLLLAALRYRFGTALAIVGSALLFSLVHVEWLQILAALPLGLMLGAYVARGGSLYVTAAAHILGNGFSFLGLVLPGVPWISADWRPSDTEGAFALLAAVSLFGWFLRRYPIE
ncbi:MAG: lysostaphin resistance A-like protein, partial [Methylohalobius sp.]